MKVFVTGGTGVVGTAAVQQLLERGHTVRLFSRNARKDSEQWAAGVEPHEGSVGDPQSVRGSADGCQAILHIAGIVAESPPEVTFEKINVAGTQNLVDEAERAGVRRFVYVSSLGAERGSSAYHRSKRDGEEIVRRFTGDWLIVRPGNVYGPGDDLISLLLKMVRALPAIPVIDGGDQEFQPIWTSDLAVALARAVERDDLSRQTLELAGEETTSINDLIERFERLTDKHPARIPLPGWLASAGNKVAELFGAEMPVTEDQLTMLREGNVIGPGKLNALTEIFHVRPAPLEMGLAQLADLVPEQLPSEGTGQLRRRRYWADIVGSPLSAEDLFARIREEFGSYMPESTADVDAEPGTPSRPDEGATLTLGMPLRGNVQVRVEEVTARSMTLVTVQGHPLAGAMRMLVEERGDGLRFEVQTYDRPANVVDAVSMATIGRLLKHATWETVVENVVRGSGGRAPAGVQRESEALDAEQARRVEEWIERLIAQRKRERSMESASAARPASPF